MNIYKTIILLLIPIEFAVFSNAIFAERQIYNSGIPDIPTPDASSQRRLYRQMTNKNHLNGNPDKGYQSIGSKNFSTGKTQNKEIIFPYIQEDLEKIKTLEKEEFNIRQNTKKKRPVSPKKKLYNKHSTNYGKQKPVSTKYNPQIRKINKQNPRKLSAAKVKNTNIHKPGINTGNKKIIAGNTVSSQNQISNFEMTWRRLLKNSKTVPGFSKSIEPQKRGPYRYSAPDYYRGIYLNNATARNSGKFKRILKESKKFGINVLVIDTQPKIPSNNTIKLARESGFYLVSRIVVFPGGLKKYPPSRKHIERIANLAVRSADAGFMEIQLDYIRFTDYWKGKKLSHSQRYRTVSSVIQYITKKIQPYGLRTGADIFGRIPFNRNDRIGQNLEIFALHLDTLYPMLYPSHFYGDRRMQNKPYLPIYWGTKKSIQRVGHKSKIIPYIQAFNIHVKPTKLSYRNYIYKQLVAAWDSGGSGFIAWNAGNHYKYFFSALKKFDKTQKSKMLTNTDS